jgi:hypothetical protein
MRKLKEGEQMPLDFWNYLVNPIVGFYVEPLRNDQSKKVESKYAKTTQTI